MFTIFNNIVTKLHHIFKTCLFISQQNTAFPKILIYIYKDVENILYSL